MENLATFLVRKISNGGLTSRPSQAPISSALGVLHHQHAEREQGRSRTVVLAHTKTSFQSFLSVCW